MPEPLQPGSHLSPDQLSAFAENVLPEHERLATLTHLSACADCRQVVFLAQQADPAPIATPAAETPRRGWFTLPQLFGAAAAALACSLILALIIHFQHGQDSAATPVTTAQVQTPAPIAPPSSVPATPAQEPAKQPSTADVRTVPPSPQKPAMIGMAPTSQPMGAMAAGRASGISSEAKMAAPNVQGNESLAADSVTSVSNFAALAPQKSPPLPTMSMQVTAAPPPPAAEDRARQTAKDMANTHVSSTNETVEVAAAAPMITTENATVSTTVDAESVQGLPLNMRAIARIKLPSKMPVASQLNAGNRTLALDTAGALFVSKDHGKHWTTVATQWTGKAVQLSFAATPARLYLAQPAQNQTQGQISNSNSGAAIAGGISQQQAPIPTAGFELSTSTGAVWLSTDGLTWHAR